LVRDLAKFEEVYEVKEIQPVDMFPFTGHVETVTVLTLKNKGL
jgi:23S rRNA (uracil1939-C5)-methyltransferase